MNPEPEIIKTAAKFGTTVVSKTLEKLLEDVLAELRAGQNELRAGQKELHAGQETFRADLQALRSEMHAGFARTTDRLDRVSSRMDDCNKRIDDVAARQGKTFEAVTALKRDQTTTADLLHRMARIEDRVFAQAG